MKNKILGILRSDATRRINFSFAGARGIVRVSHKRLLKVARAIEGNKIHIQMGGVPDGVAKYSAWAHGDSKANTIYIGKMQYSSRDFDALMVHECVHAYFDISRTTIEWVDNEAAAYIAQGYYLRNSGYDIGRMSSTGMPYFGRMIVQAIRGGEEADGFWMKALTEQLQTNPLYTDYINDTFQGNG